MTIEFNSLFYISYFLLTIILLIAKLILIIYLGWETYQKTKKAEKFTYDFQFSILIVFICLFFSRILFLIFDYLYEFDPDKLYIMPNIIVWKVATLIYCFGFANLLFVLDRKTLKFKFKGIFAYILIIVALIILFYPVYSAEDFLVVSYLTIIANITAIIIPFTFFYAGYNIIQFRKYFYMMGFGTILYAIGGNMANDLLLDPIRTAFGNEIIVFIYLFFSIILKIIGLSMITWGVKRII